MDRVQFLHRFQLDDHGVFDQQVDPVTAVKTNLLVNDAVVLGCTEIPLLMNDSNSPLPTLDSTRLLARAAVLHALESSAAESS